MLSVVLPPRCAVTKYHKRSLAIGPPMRAGDVVDLAERARRGDALVLQSSVSGCRTASFSPVPLKKSEPCVELPPVFGTRFTTSPPVSRLAQPTRAGEGDFLGGAGVDHIAGRASCRSVGFRR